MAAAIGGLLFASAAAYGHDVSPVMLSKYFKYHDFDKQILTAMGHGTGSVLYIRELGSMTSEEVAVLKKYENIGCNPFYFVQRGEIEELGYNCRTFFCTGYLEGPKQCEDTAGKAYGGVVEINRRLNGVKEIPKKKYFEDFAEAARTQAMQRRIDMLNMIRCKPFYMVEFNSVAVSEGYECEELGSFPRYSPANNCIHDWGAAEDEYVCDVDYEENEYQLRLDILGIKMSSASSKSYKSSARSTSSKSSAMSASSVSSNKSPAFFIGEGWMAHEALNRGAWLKLLMMNFKNDMLTKERGCFPDVASQDFAAAVCTARRLKFVAGYPSGRFLPGASVNHAEAIKMLINVQDIELIDSGELPADVPAGSWFAPYVRTAVSLGILSSNDRFRPEALLTRKEAAAWVGLE